MKKRIKLLATLLAAAILAGTTGGCKGVIDETSGTVYEKIQSKLINMETYEAEASVKYISNKNSHTYNTVQRCRMSGEYRIEVVGPESVAGNITLSDGKIICQFNSKITGKISVGTTESPERTEILLTSFVKNYVKSREVSVSVASIDGGECTVLEANIPGDHPYLQTEKLWVDNKTLKPVQMIIYDPSGNERVVVSYEKFEYNIALSDSLFIIE